MRRVIERTALGIALCAVALLSSGCFLRIVLGGIVVESLSEEIDLVITNVQVNASAAVCRPSPFTGATECTYVVSDPEGFLATTTSTASLLTDFGLFGVIIDPLILQVPSGLSGVLNVSGTVDDLSDTNPPVPLAITTATSFFAQPGTEIVAEPGHVFIIADFPASVASTLTTTGKEFSFTLSFRLTSPRGQFSAGLPVKPMLTGKVETGGQTFYPPMFPCTTSFAGVPTVTLPAGGPANLFARILGAFGQQNLGCANAVYDFRTIGTRADADHFQCYETVDSRGSVCSAGSPQNLGRTCKKETDCGGVEDDTAFCVPKGFPKGLKVFLADQFESGSFEVKRPVALCNPADKNDEGISDPSTHLRSYKIQAAPGQPAHTMRTGIRIQNQFHPEGELQIDTISPDRLLVPTAKSLTQAVTALDAASHDVDHFKCYKVRLSRGAPTFPRIPNVSIVDQFQQPGLVDVSHPTRLCTPVDKNDEGIKNESNHLMCYQVIPVKQPRRVKHTSVSGIFLNNQFGPEIVDTAKEGEFCVPSLKVLQQPVP